MDFFQKESAAEAKMVQKNVYSPSTTIVGPTGGVAWRIMASLGVRSPPTKVDRQTVAIGGLPAQNNA